MFRSQQDPAYFLLASCKLNKHTIIKTKWEVGREGDNETWSSGLLTSYLHIEDKTLLAPKYISFALHRILGDADRMWVAECMSQVPIPISSSCLLHSFTLPAWSSKSGVLSSPCSRPTGHHCDQTVVSVTGQGRTERHTHTHTPQDTYKSHKKML